MISPFREADEATPCFPQSFGTHVRAIVHRPVKRKRTTSRVCYSTSSFFNSLCNCSCGRSRAHSLTSSSMKPLFTVPLNRLRPVTRCPCVSAYVTCCACVLEHEGILNSPISSHALVLQAFLTFSACVNKHEGKRLSTICMLSANLS